MPPHVISLRGPTASGKTDLAVWLCQRFPLEIVSVDSALVYRDMNIGTAKPDAATLAQAPHHLIDLLDPTEAYSAGRFKHDALAVMAQIRARGNIPLLAGGTMLYFRALRGGLDDLPPADPAIRAELEAQAAISGWPAMHARLHELDPETAQRLKPNDSQRIQRALELCLTTGGPMSALFTAQTPNTQEDWLEFALFPADRAWLHQRINLRFEQMLEQGLVDERHPPVGQTATDLAAQLGQRDQAGMRRFRLARCGGDTNSATACHALKDNRRIHRFRLPQPCSVTVTPFTPAIMPMC